MYNYALLGLNAADKMPFPPINLHSRISSPGKDLFGKKKSSTSVVPPQSLLDPKSREEKETEKDKLSTSWPSANLRQLGRKPQQHYSSRFPTDCSVPNLDVEDVKSSWLHSSKPLGGSCESVPRSSSGESAARRAKDELEQEVHFSLSLTPEAILVIQKRNLEKQMLAKQQKCCGSTDTRHRRALASTKRAQQQGASNKTTGPGAKLDSSTDISAILKISLLNEQHKYDDVEYEEEDGDVDETVMRKCKEWLKGVESAAAFGKVDKLSALPHLKSC